MFDITYGICVSPNTNLVYLDNLLKSIESQYIGRTDDYEIILVGEVNIIMPFRYKYRNVQLIPFDESVRKGWITKKKNLIAERARYGHVCIMHDYFMLEEDWLRDWDWYINNVNCHVYPKPIFMNRVVTREGERSADWLVSPVYMERLIDDDPEKYSKMLMEVAPHENHPKYVCGLSYYEERLNHIQYISGGFIFCETGLLMSIPFDESKAWGDAEDVDWSLKLNAYKVPIMFNRFAQIRIQKPNKWHVYEMPYEFTEALIEKYGRMD